MTAVDRERRTTVRHLSRVTRSRALPLGVLLVLAPICAEFIQAYLPITGRPLELVGALLVLAPLYGGTAVLIRETAVRTGRGWPGVLLLAAAFGVVQAGIVDMSLFLSVDTGVPAFDEAFTPTLVGLLGVSAAASTTWVGGHVVMSIGVPVALVHWAWPRWAGRPWLGPRGLAVMASLVLGAAALIHADQRSVQGGGPSKAQLVGATVVAGALVALALSRIGRPLPTTTQRVPPRALWLLCGAFAVKLTAELVPPTWLGVSVVWVLAAGTVVSVARLSVSGHWRDGQPAALAAGALLAWVVIGFLAPAVPGVDPTNRLVHNLVFGVLAVLLAIVVVRRDQRRCATGSAKDDAPTPRARHA
jgi:hypothetical protein